jgi:hypothetical protein
MNPKKKSVLAIVISLIFILLSLPYTYQYFDKISKKAGIRFSFDDCPGVPTITGIVFNAILIGLILRCILHESKDSMYTPKIVVQTTEIEMEDDYYEPEEEEEDLTFCDPEYDL